MLMVAQGSRRCWPDVRRHVRPDAGVGTAVWILRL